MAFEKFTADSRGALSATLAKSGILLFSTKSVAKYNLLDAVKRYAQLYYDNETCEIGITLTDDSIDATRIRKTCGSATISAYAFRKHFNIPAETTHYSIRESESMLILTPVK